MTSVSPAMFEMFETVIRLAPTDLPVTLIGETGVGKQVLAHTIHDLSRRSAAPFEVFDCAAVPPSGIEAALFGHDRAGAFERAARGTLFLTDLVDLPLELQPRLLRLLEGGPIRRAAGPARTDSVRVVLASSRALPELATEQRLRVDLYTKLGAAVVQVPALRDRLEDLPLLVLRLLRDLGRPDVTVAAGTLDLLKAHAWPGNVRELKDALAFALAFVEDPLRQAPIMEPHHVRLVSGETRSAQLDRLPLAGLGLAQIEVAAIRQTIAKTGGNKVQAAKMLGIATSTLYEKLKKYRL